MLRGRAGISHPGHRPTPAPHSWQVNDTAFQNLTREEAVNFLLGLPVGEEVELVTQRKQDSECVCVCVCACERERERERCAWPTAECDPQSGPGEGWGLGPTSSRSLPIQSSRRWCGLAWATPSTSARTLRWSPARHPAWASPAETSSTCWTHCTLAPGRVPPGEASGWQCAWGVTSGRRSGASSPTRAGGDQPRTGIGLASLLSIPGGALWRALQKAPANQQH